MIKFSIILAFVIFLLVVPTKAATIMPESVLINTPVSPSPSLDFLHSLSSMKNRQVEKMIGRKLVFKEKVALQLLRWKHFGPDPGELTHSKKGQTSKILGIVALGALLIFPLGTLVCGILAIVYGTQAKKENPNDKDAKTGTILGIIALGLFLVLILLVIAVFAAFYGGWG